MARRDADDDADDDEEYEEPRPKKKKSKKSRRDDEDDDSRGYKSSPIRFVILGVLVLAMLVLGFFLVRKIMNERAAGAARGITTAIV